MKKILLGATVFMSTVALAQDSLSTSNPLTFSGYIETYYTYDFNKPVDNNRPGFIYSHNRHNEFNANLGFVKASYNAEKVRANLALAAGTYMNANYAAEPGVLKNIYEANAGFKIGKKNLWLDAGIFSSHIGFESAIGKDNSISTSALPSKKGFGNADKRRRVPEIWLAGPSEKEGEFAAIRIFSGSTMPLV